MPLMDAGRSMLSVHLKRRKVLVVADDTDDVAQLKNLLPPCVLHPESLIIVTSRNEAVLNKRCSSVVKVELIPKGFYLQLFRAWAFAAGPPDEHISALVPEVVTHCGQLPLTLKVGIALALFGVTRTSLLQTFTNLPK